MERRVELVYWMHGSRDVARNLRRGGGGLVGRREEKRGTSQKGSIIALNGAL